MGARNPPGYVWAFSGAVGLFMLICNEIRKYLIRNCPKLFIVRFLKWWSFVYARVRVTDYFSHILYIPLAEYSEPVIHFSANFDVYFGLGLD